MADPAFEAMLERYMQEWESGRFDRLIPAFMLCAAWAVPVPEWLRDAVLDDLHFAYANRPAAARASSRTRMIQNNSNRKHQTRYLMLQTAIDQQVWDIEHGRRTEPFSLKEAAQSVEKMLRVAGSHDRGSWSSIIDSYNALKTNAE